jgi:hypothetical protein
VYTCGKNDKYQLLRNTTVGANADVLAMIEGVPLPKVGSTRKVSLTDYGIFVFDIAPRSKDLTRKKLLILQQEHKLCDLYIFCKLI